MEFRPADDAALRALLWPFQTGELLLPEAPVLFLGARPGFWHDQQRRVSWRCEQPFAPFAVELGRRGVRVQARVEETGFAMTLVLPPRQREEARSLLARAIRASVPGGRVVAAAGNHEGARSLEADLKALAGVADSVSKYKSRVFWAEVDGARLDAVRLDQWLALDAPRQVGDGDDAFWTRPGLFAWDRIDAASALLAKRIPATLSGRVADLGAGWGYLAMQVIQRCPNVTAIDLFEANARALDPARRNLDMVLAGRERPVVTLHWHDVSSGLPGRYDAIVSNPPFHIGQGGRADLPELGRAFIRRAADALEPDGQAWLVANRHLPYEALLGERFHDVRALVQQDGYKVIHACGPRR